MSDTPDLTDKQLAVVRELPSTTRQIADALDTSTDAVRRRIGRINAKYSGPDDYPIFTDPDGLRVWDGEKDLHRMKSHHTGSVTRAANNFLTDDEAGIKSLLNNVEPATVSEDPSPDNEDVCIFLTDLHFGDRVTDERGRETFNTNIITQRVMQIVKKAIREARALKNREIDAWHLILGGDLITNSALYEGQWEHLDHGVAATIREQMDAAAEVLMWAIHTLAQEAHPKPLRIVGVPGNHGENRASGVSKQANADIHILSRVDLGVRYSQLDNVGIRFHDSTQYANFTMRGGKVRGHVRHGQNCQEHAGATAASKRDWRGWLNMHDFDVAFRGHFHECKVERVLGHPIIQGGSVKPPSDFEESISEWGGPGAVVFGVSDEQVPTWMHMVEW